jgi:hypothetical protein
MRTPFYSLYSKQHEIESLWDRRVKGSWACGFASLVTCFRLLGDRSTEDVELVRQFRKIGGKPSDGMSSENVVMLARAMGYGARHRPRLRNWETLDRWLNEQFHKRLPVMISVDTAASENVADHWWVVYGDPAQDIVWVMDPACRSIPFQMIRRDDLARFAACNDLEDYLEYDAVVIIPPRGGDLNGIAPSVVLMEFLNERKVFSSGWTSEMVAAALVDNHLGSVGGLPSQGRATGRKGVPVSLLLVPDGEVAAVLGHWDAFFYDSESESMASLVAILCDLEAHLEHNIFPDEQTQLVHEVVLNCMLIGTRLASD